MPTKTFSELTLIIALSLLSLHAAAQEDHASDHGMDMGTDTAMVMASGHMITYLHFTTGGDTIWFEGWVPSSTGAIAGTCLGLFLLAIVERWVGAVRAGAEGFWRRRAQVLQSRATLQSKREKPYAPIDTRSLASSSSDAGALHKSVPSAMPPLSHVVLMRSAPPFVLAHDVARGVMHAGQAALGFAFMLVVMTYNVAFIISIVVGLGVGETLFGRYMSVSGVGH